MNRSNPSAAESASEVSAALVPRSAELAADIYHLIVQEIPALRGDRRVLALLEASVAENVSTLLHILQHGIDLENVRAPAAAQEYARGWPSTAFPLPPCCAPTGSVRPGSRSGACRSSHGTPTARRSSAPPGCASPEC